MAWHGKGGRLSSVVNGLTYLSGWVAYSVIAALVFGETAVFLGFAALDGVALADGMPLEPGDLPAD